MRAVYKIFLYVLIIAVALFSCSCGDESSELQETTVTQVCSLLSGYKIKYSRHTKVNLERDWLFLF